MLLVQATSAAHVGDRLQRVQARPELPALLAAGVAVEVWGWAKRGRRWQVKIVAVRAADLAGVVVEVPPRRPGGRPWAPLPLFDREAAAPPPDVG